MLIARRAWCSRSDLNICLNSLASWIWYYWNISINSCGFILWYPCLLQFNGRTWSSSAFLSLKLREHIMSAKFSKCKFQLCHVIHLIHVSSAQGIATNPEIFKAIVYSHPSLNFNRLRSFSLGCSTRQGIFAIHCVIPRRAPFNPLCFFYSR